MKRYNYWAVKVNGNEENCYPMSRKADAELALRNMADGKGKVVRVVIYAPRGSRADTSRPVGL